MADKAGSKPPIVAGTPFPVSKQFLLLINTPDAANNLPPPKQTQLAVSLFPPLPPPPPPVVVQSLLLLNPHPNSTKGVTDTVGKTTGNLGKTVGDTAGNAGQTLGDSVSGLTKGLGMTLPLAQLSPSESVRLTSLTRRHRERSNEGRRRYRVRRWRGGKENWGRHVWRQGAERAESAGAVEGVFERDSRGQTWRDGSRDVGEMGLSWSWLGEM